MNKKLVKTVMEQWPGLGPKAWQPGFSQEKQFAVVREQQTHHSKTWKKQEKCIWNFPRNKKLKRRFRKTWETKTEPKKGEFRRGQTNRHPNKNDRRSKTPEHFIYDDSFTTVHTIFFASYAFRLKIENVIRRNSSYFKKSKICI